MDQRDVRILCLEPSQIQLSFGIVQIDMNFLQEVAKKFPISQIICYWNREGELDLPCDL